MRRIGSWCATVPPLVLLIVSTAAWADYDSAATNAATWLEASQAQDGSWGGNTEVQAVHATEAVNALRAFGWKRPAYQRGIAWIENHAMSNVDFAARRIVALATHGDNVDADLDTLYFNFSFKHADGNGWGLSYPHIASPYDTALALLAQNAAGIPDSPDTEDGLNFLLSTQNANGGWPVVDLDTVSNEITTALVLLAFASLADDYTGLETSAGNAVTYLLTNVAVTSSMLEQGLAARALLAWTPATTSADVWLDYLESVQLPNGSWGDDPYATAAVLHALAARLGRDTVFLQAKIPIADLGLRAALNLALGKNRVDSLTRGEMQSLTDLNVANFGILDLTGIGELTNLATLDLTGNTGIGDFTPLDSLPTGVVVIPPSPYCDLNEDGSFGAVDAMLVIRAVNGVTTLTPSQGFSADIAPPSSVGDGIVTVNTGDTIVILRALRGLNTACD